MSFNVSGSVLGGRAALTSPAASACFLQVAGLVEKYKTQEARKRVGGPTYFFVGGENSESSACGLLLFRRTECPERDRPTTELGEPALQLGLRGVMR